ncbi:glycosyltransferase family 2 protein [Leptothrix sp. BB-4]
MTVDAGLTSVAMVVYNGQQDIRAAIDSVLAQRHVRFELVVVDDGSTDGTWDILQSYGDRLRPVRQPNGGLPVARNTALANCRGDVIALMDHDDLCHPDRLACQRAVLDRFPEVGLVSSDFSAFDANGRIDDSHIAHYYSQCSPDAGGVAALYPVQERIDLSALLDEPRIDARSVELLHGQVYTSLAAGNFVHPPTVMVRRSVVDQAGVFDPAMRTMCDWDWLVRVSRVTSLAYLGAPLLDYRRSDRQMSSQALKPRSSVDALNVAMHICSRDPGLFHASERLLAQLGELHASAAYANGELQPLLALTLMANAVLRYRYHGKLLLPTIVRSLMPGWLLDALRSLKQRRSA